MGEERGPGARDDVASQPLLFGYREIPRTLARQRRDAMPEAQPEPERSERLEPTRFTLAAINERLAAAGDDTLTMDEIAESAVIA
jgi:hypothetical protein